MPNKQEKPQASFIPKRLFVQIRFPSVSKCSALAQGLDLYFLFQESMSWLSILSPRATVSLGRNSYTSSASQAPSHLSLLCPDSLDISGFCYYLSGNFLTSSVYPSLPWGHLLFPSHPPETVQIATVFIPNRAIPTRSSLNQNLIICSNI